MAPKKSKAKYNTTMLVDDSEIDNFINLKMIEGCNFAERVYVHSNGKSALEFLKNLERLDSKDGSLFPELIFLDLNMPIMDGFQFVEEFEKIPAKFAASTKIIILTTSLNPNDMERSKRHPHIVKFINKPLSQATLDLI